MIGEVFVHQIFEMVVGQDATSAAALDEPSSSRLSSRPSEKEAQHVLELLHDLMPRKKTAPTDDAVEVRGISADRVQPPTPVAANVGASQDEDLLELAGEGDLWVLR